RQRSRRGGGVRGGEALYGGRDRAAGGLGGWQLPGTGPPTLHASLRPRLPGLRHGPRAGRPPDRAGVHPHPPAGGRARTAPAVAVAGNGRASLARAGRVKSTSRRPPWVAGGLRPEDGPWRQGPGPSGCRDGCPAAETHPNMPTVVNGVVTPRPVTVSFTSGRPPVVVYRRPAVKTVLARTGRLPGRKPGG